MEHLNKRRSTQGQGGICRITSRPKTLGLLKFCLIGPELARFAEEAECLTVVFSGGVVAWQHHCPLHFANQSPVSGTSCCKAEEGAYELSVTYSRDPVPRLISRQVRCSSSCQRKFFLKVSKTGSSAQRRFAWRLSQKYTEACLTK